MGSENDSNVQRPSEGDEVPIFIRCSNGSRFMVKTNLESTVEDFKAVVARNCDTPAHLQRLIYKGRILKDDQTLQSYGLQADHNVHMVRSFAPSSPAPALNTAGGGNPNTAASVTDGFGSIGGGGLGGTGHGASLFPGLGLNAAGSGAPSGLFGSRLPNLDQMRQQQSLNPDMMRDLMNMPAIQNLMDNPELFRSMIMNNPQMREVIDRNPELAHILNDPGILRQSLEIARNPELMREMMRHTDRAMSNIESSPEGFNMLRRMYENIQEPFLSAPMSGNTGNDSNSFGALMGNQGGTQARDSSTNNPPAAGSETNAGLAVPNSNPLPNPWSNAGGGTRTNSNARTNPAGDMRGQGLGGGLEGFDLQGMEQMLNGMPDISQVDQMLQNPATMQMMQNLFSNPQYMNQIQDINSQLNGGFENTQLRELMQNPEVLRQLTSPETMQQILSLQQSLMSQLNQQSSTREPAQPGVGSGTDNARLDMMMNLFGGLGAGGLGAPFQPNVPPEELYATQLSQLQEMGFFDTQENIQALLATSGNVHAAVERLLGNMR